MCLKAPHLLHIRFLQMRVFNPLLQDINLLPGTGGCFVAFGVDVYPQMALPSPTLGCPHTVYSSVLRAPIAELTALFSVLSTDTCLCVSLHKTCTNYLHRVCTQENRASLDRRRSMAAEEHSQCCCTVLYYCLSCWLWSHRHVLFRIALQVTSSD